MHELTEIALKIGNNDKAKDHSHTEFYGPLLTPHKHTFLDVLEIGIYMGGSLLMWKEFFPNAQIHGIDIEEHEKAKHLRDEDRITTYFEDAYTKEFYDKIKHKSFDFILDDGPHTVETWNLFLNNYVKLLKPGGILIIEDIFTAKQAVWLVKNFQGDKNRLSIIDRRGCPNACSTYTNEILILYM